MTAPIAPSAAVAPIALPAWQRRSVYAVTAALVVTGLAWLVVAGPFAGGEADAATAASRAAAAWAMRLHGASAYAALVVVGTVLPVHLRLAWQRRRNRWSGSTLAALLGVLAASGLWLYYGGEAGHATVSWLHWGLGLALPVWVAVHRGLGRATRRAR